MPAVLHQGYRPGCIGRIVELHARYYAARAGFGAGFEAKVARELADFCSAFQPDRDGLWLVVQDGQVEGSIAIDGACADEHGAHLRWFILSDAIRGQGLGRQLLASAIGHVDARQYRQTHLWTFAGLDAARHLYESVGFQLAHEASGDQWGTVVSEQRFERLLKVS